MRVITSFVLRKIKESHLPQDYKNYMKLFDASRNKMGSRNILPVHLAAMRRNVPAMIALLNLAPDTVHHTTMITTNLLDSDDEFDVRQLFQMSRDMSHFPQTFSDSYRILQSVEDLWEQWTGGAGI